MERLRLSTDGLLERNPLKGVAFLALATACQISLTSSPHTGYISLFPLGAALAGVMFLRKGSWNPRIQLVLVLAGLGPIWLISTAMVLSPAYVLALGRSDMLPATLVAVMLAGYSFWKLSGALLSAVKDPRSTSYQLLPTPQ